MLVLAACGGTPDPQASTEPAASTAAVSESAAASATPSVAASAEASTDTAALSDDEKAAQLQGAYGPLVLLNASLVAVDDTAQRAASGAIDDIELMGTIIGLSLIVKTATEALAGDAPISAVASVWEDARAAGTELQDVVDRWDDQQLSPADVAGQLEPLKSRVETIMTTAERDLGAQFDIPSAELQQIRTEAIAEMQEGFASPAAVPSAAANASTAPDASAAAEASTAPEASAAADTSAAPVATGPGTSRAEPVALGTPLVFETWAVTVTEVLRGDAARQAIADANQFNSPPRDGFEYLLVTMQLENISDKPEAQNVASGIGLRATGDRNVSYPIAAVVPPQPLEGELLPDATTTGQQVVEVPSGEGNLMFVVSELLNINLPARYVAIDANARVTPDPALDAIAPTDVGASRETAAKLGETVATDDWQVTLLEVKRGEEAATLIKDSNQFNDPPAAGSEYVLLRVRVRSIGSDAPDTAQSAALGALKLTGASNVAYEAPTVVAPDPRLDALLFPGGEAEGWLALSAAEGEQNLVAVWEPLFSFDSAQTRYLALQ